MSSTGSSSILQFVIAGVLLAPWVFPAGSSAQGITFTDVTIDANVSYLQRPTLVFGGGKYVQPFMTGGAAAGDYDGDGWVDLFVTRLDAPPILFRNNTDGTFTDVTFGAGLGGAQPTGSNGTGWADIDNDGDLDLYVTSYDDSKFYLYINNGNGQFTEEGVLRDAALAGQDPRFGQSVAFGDYDGDGFLDIHTTEWRWDDDVQNRSNMPSNNRLLRNLGATKPGYFEDVTDSAGVAIDGVEDDRFSDRLTGSWGFSSRFSDFDGDGNTDLAIVADFGESRLFWNDGNGKFTDGTLAAGVGSDRHGMGSTVADFNGDGLLDWFITSIFSDFGVPGNRMFYNNGDRTFTDVTTQMGVRKGGWGWGTSALDYDNDGDQDLVMTNGVHFEGALFFQEDPMRLWRNDGANFTDVSNDTGITDTGIGKGLLTFDYDKDGDLDLFVVNHGGQPVLYRNDGGNDLPWLRIRTVGTESNRDGIGALITVFPDLDDPENFMVQEVDGGSNFLSQNERISHFGLGEGTTAVDLVTIRWPSGIVQELTGLSANTLLLVTEPAGVPEPSSMALLLMGIMYFWMPCHALR